MLYRDHRGSLADSMETIQEIDSIEQLKQHLDKIWAKTGHKITEVKFEYMCFDSRTDWKTYYVLQRFEGENDFVVAGMSDSILIK